LLLEGSRIQSGRIPSMLARRFLWAITIIVLLVLAAAVAYRLFAPQLMRAAFVPSVSFGEDRRPPGPDYRSPAMWIARPDLPGSPALWTAGDAKLAVTPHASVFFVHPTSYLERTHWNASLDDAVSQQRARVFVRSQASAFNGVGEVWAPKYRQAAVGAFLTDREDADLALAFAYRDVLAAFEQFLKEVPPDRPIILAGHSQGSYHLTRLLAERIAATPVAKRIAAAYVIGWPLSMTIDIPRFGLPACLKAADSGCIVSWESFAEPAEPKQLTAIYEASAGPNGRSRAGTPLLCVNPLTGNARDAAPASANLGTLIPDASLARAELRPHLVPARCDSRGLLLIGEDPPQMPPYVLPGNNYHVFDYALFWANLRADAERRLAAFEAR
jgi:hypothetical protein